MIIITSINIVSIASVKMNYNKSSQDFDDVSIFMKSQVSINFDLHSPDIIQHPKLENIFNEELDLENFKTIPCDYTIQHNHKHCFFFHNDKDKRRENVEYSADMCPNIAKKRKCHKGENCTKSHNRVEQLFRPEKYKMKFCTFYPQKLKDCEYGQFCCFAHSEKEIKVKLIHNYVYDEDFYMFHYKTEWCPFNLSYHNKSLCVYAHNWQDFRRKPAKFYYEPVSCPKWKIKDYITKYDEGCPHGEKCDKCHGWKELEYHPLCYKAKPCPLGSECPKKRECTNYHNFSEQRDVSKLAVHKITKYFPRNRYTGGTFKRSQNFLNFLNEVGVVQNESHPNLGKYLSTCLNCN